MMPPSRVYALSGKWGQTPAAVDHRRRLAVRRRAETQARRAPSSAALAGPTRLVVDEDAIRTEMERRLVVRGWLVPRTDRRIA